MSATHTGWPVKAAVPHAPSPSAGTMPLTAWLTDSGMLGAAPSISRPVRSSRSRMETRMLGSRASRASAMSRSRAGKSAPANS